MRFPPATHLVVGFEHRAGRTSGSSPIFASGWRSSVWSCTPTRPGSSSSGGFAARTARRGASGSRRRSTSWASRTSAGRPRTGRFWLKRMTISKRMRAKLEEVKDQLPAAPASAHPGTGALAGKRGARAPRLLRRARQHRRRGGLPQPGDAALVQGAAAPQPAHPPHLEADGPPRHPMAATCPHPASLPTRALRRQHPRQEPSAVVPHAGICAGGRPQGRSLPRHIRDAGTNRHRERNERVRHRRSSAPRWPRPCVGVRKGDGEALDRGTCRQGYGAAKSAFRGADVVRMSGGSPSSAPCRCRRSLVPEASEV